MNKLGWLIILFVGCGICTGQNLVPNGDFEQHSACPYFDGQIYMATPWVNPATGFPSGGTPDYYHQCGTQNLNIPFNWLGFQQAHSGNAYAGIYLYDGIVGNVREYIEVQLTSPLTPGQCYHFEMYVNLGNDCKVSVDHIGVYFSDTLVSGINNVLLLPFTSQINNTIGNYPDTLNWTLISGNLTATGTENYIIIGSFADDVTNGHIIINPSAPELISYIFIDDVSLTLCTGIEEQNNDDAIKIYPNPFNDKLSFSTIDNQLCEIILYDITSRKILNQTFTNSISINTEELSKGIYIYEVRNKNGVIKKGKLIHH